MAVLDISPELIDVGVAIGVMSVPAGQQPANAVLNDDFFARPEHYLGGVFTQPGQRDAVLRIAGRMMSPDGPPIIGPAGEQWVSIVNGATGDAVTSGLFLVTRPIGNDLLISLGAQVERTDDVTLRLVTRIPLFLVRQSGATFAPGTANGDIQVEVTAVLGDEGPLGVELVTAGLSIPTDGRVPSAVVRLVRPPDGDEGDIIVTTTDPVGAQAARVLTQLIGAFAEDISGDLGDATRALLGLLGLDPASGVPALPLEAILADGRSAVWGWLQSIFSTSAAQSWIGRLADLLGVAVSGAGTAASPWDLCFAAGPVSVCLVVSAVADGGALIVTPAIRVGVPAPASLGVAGRADLTARLVTLRLAADPAATFTPDVSATITVGTIAGASTLVTTPVPVVGGNVAIGALRAGLAVDTSGTRLVLEAHRATFPNVPTFAVLDLTDTDAVLDAGGAVLDGAIDGLLQALGDSPAARLVFVLCGLRRPDGTTNVDWPHEVAITELFTDPLAAVRGYHLEVLAAGQWDRLADEFGALLRAAGGAAGVTGDGTEAAPWTVSIAVGATGRAELIVWSTTDDDGTRLHLGTRLALPGRTIASGAAVGLAVTAELLSLRLAGVGGASSDLDPIALPGLSAAIELGDDLHIDIGSLGILAERISAGIRWSPTGGIEPRLRIDGAELALGGATAALPLPVWDADERRFRFEGDIPWEIIERLAAQLLESLASAAAQALPALFGWRSNGAAALPAIPPLPGVPASPFSTVQLRDLATDPLGTLGRALVSLLTGPQGREWANTALGWVATLTQGAGDALSVTGTGATADPWAVPLTGSGRAIELVVSVGDSGGALGGVARRLMPAELDAVLDLDDASGVHVALLITAVRALALLDPAVGAIVTRTVDPETSLADLRTAIVGTDGLVTAAAQHGLVGAAPTVAGIGNLALPAAFVDAHLAAGAPAAAGRIFVRTAIRGTSSWPGETAGRTIDLTAPGLPAESFDLSALPVGGPWFVVLPTRLGTGAATTADGHLEQVARLRRVVDTLRSTRPAGSPLALIAHGPAGHVARAVAASAGAGVTHLSLLGTSIATVPTLWADDVSAGDALRMLQGLRELTGAAAGALGEADELLDLLAGVSDGPPPDASGSLAGAVAYPVADVAPPAGLAALPGSVAVATVAADLDAATVDLALGRLFGELLRARTAVATVPDELRIGVRANPTTTTANGIRLACALALDAVTLPLDFGDDALETPATASNHPRLRVRLTLDRPTGWLLGGPTGAPPAERRDPRVRSVDVDLAIDLADGTARCTLVLHDAAVFGIARARWPITLGLDPTSGLAAHLAQEDRVLLGELVAALGPRPANGALTTFLDALVALGLGTIQPDGRLALDVDPVEQLLLDARTALPRMTSLGRGALATALASLSGGTAAGSLVTVPLGDGATVSVDLGSPSTPVRITLATAGSGIELAGGSTIGGSVAVDSTGHVAVGATLGFGSGEGPNGRFGVGVTVDTAAATPVTAQLTRSGGAEGMARSVALAPVPDLPGIEQLATAAAPGEIARLVLEFAARELPALSAVLDAVGLRDPIAGRVRVPAGLMADPAGWFLSAATLGAADGRPDPARIQALLAAMRSLIPGPHPADGIALPWGLALRSSETAGTLRVALGLPNPVALGSLRVAGAAGLELAPSGALTPTFAATVDLTDPAAPASILGGVDIALGSTVSASARIPLGGSILTVPILPISGGLGGLAAAATRALPLALDALTRIGTFGGVDIGASIGALADSLDLRTGAGPTFDLAQLELFAADPATQLISRLTLASNRVDLANALRLLLDPVLPGTIGGAAGVVALTLSSHLQVTVDFTPSVPTVCLLASDVRPIPELSIGGELCLGAGGVREIRASVEIADPDLLRLGGVSLLPGVSFAAGVDTTRPDGLIEFALWTAGPAAAAREALVVRVDLASGVSIRWRNLGLAIPDVDDPLAAAFGLARSYLIPLATEMVLGIEAVRDILERNLLTTTTKIGELLHPKILERSTGGGQVRYRMSLFDTAPDGSFDVSLLLRRVLDAAGTAASAASAVAGGIPLGDLPLAVRIAKLTDAGVSRYGVAIDIPAGDQFVLFDSSDARLSLEVVDDWLADAAIQPPTVGGRGLELYVVSIPNVGAPSLSPRIVLRGLGLRIDKEDGAKLLDLGVTLRSIGVHGYVDKDMASPTVRIGGHLELDQFGLPLGDASGNPVASNFMAPTSDAGDAEQLAPAFSPSLAVVSKPTGSDVDVVVRAGPGDGPWWLPIQRAFGPLYVEQVGLAITRAAAGSDPESISILIDGGASLAGLTVQVDDLEVIIPWATPFDLTAWRLDLAGIGVGYEGGGIKMVGGLRKLDRNGSADYLGMLQVTFIPYGITAVGGYGVFPDGAGGDYVSFFGFGAVTAPIGGPPAFFVTGLGGGMGVNRRLIAPAIEDVHTFVLVQALDPFSSMAQDPMGALDQLGTTFPPERGAIWFAAGLSFTSFSLVYGTVVLTVEVHDGLEINLLGLAKMALPNPAFPIAQIELALQARMSTAEGIFSVQAQLTENSWLINESCRLTGGFAFVMWFKGEMAGQFVLSIGGYHPDFDKPAAFPAVPRLGFAWEPGFGVSIKGGSYFALTSTCVMAGGELEASYKSSIVWASLEVGVHVLVSWDPFFYDFKAYCRISAGIDIEVCFFVCGHVRMSFSFSAEVHVTGPKLRGTVTLDLDLISVTIAFGPSGATNSRNELSFAAFRDKYLRSGDDGGHVLATSITSGQVPPTATTTGTGSGADGAADDGTAARPWKVAPEFAFFVQTRAATNEIAGMTFPGQSSLRSLDLGPARKTGVTSRLVVAVVPVVGAGEVTASFTRLATLGKVPEATWTVLPTAIQPGAEVIDAVTGLSLTAKVDIAPGSITVEIEQVDIGTTVLPLPFASEGRLIGAGKLLGKLRLQSEVLSAALVLGENRFSTMYEIAAGPLGDPRLRTTAVRNDRVSPPRVVALSEGIADAARAKVTTKTVVVAPARPVKIDTTAGAPRLEAWMRAAMPVAVTTPGPLFTAGRVGDRVPAPTFASVEAEIAAPLGAWLRLAAQASPGRAETKTVLPLGRVPETRAAGLRRERVRSLRSDGSFAKLAGGVEAAMTKRAVPMRGGDVLVWSLPNSRFDRTSKRPTILVDGSARVVCLDRAGQPLADQVATKATPATVPAGTERVVLLGGAEPAGRYTGWLVDGPVVQVDERSYLGAGCVIIATSPPTRRRHRMVTTSIVRGRDAVIDASSVITRLPAASRCVVVIIDGGAGEPPRLSIGGAVAANDRPAMVQIGDRTALVVEVKATGRESISVTVADNRDLVGVAGSTLPAAQVVDQLTADGLAALGPLLPATSTAALNVRWKGSR